MEIRHATHLTTVTAFVEGPNIKLILIQVSHSYTFWYQDNISAEGIHDPPYQLAPLVDHRNSESRPSYKKSCRSIIKQFLVLIHFLIREVITGISHSHSSERPPSLFWPQHQGSFFGTAEIQNHDLLVPSLLGIRRFAIIRFAICRFAIASLPYAPVHHMHRFTICASSPCASSPAGLG